MPNPDYALLRARLLFSMILLGGSWACTEPDAASGPTPDTLATSAAELGRWGGPAWPRLDRAERFALDLLNEGRDAFRYDTYGDEAFWGGQTRLHEAIAGTANGGVGPGLSPAEALALGLRVDVDALPRSLRRALRRGNVDLNDSATTLALLELDAVIGLRGFFDSSGRITSIGIQCALCHSTVDDSFLPGIGRRQDGWPNRDLDVGKIVATAPDLSALTSLYGVSDGALRTVLRSWGPGRFDAFANLDGQVVRPDGAPSATMIPALFNLSGVGLMGWNGWAGWGTWMPFIMVLEMKAQGNFSEGMIHEPARMLLAEAVRGMNGWGSQVVGPGWFPPVAYDE